MEEISKNETRRSGYLEVILGPMFSHKSTHLSAQLTEFADVGMKCLFVNHRSDDRKACVGTSDDGSLSLHGSSSFHLSPLIDSAKVDTLAALHPSLAPYHAVAIDEAQFFEDLVEYVVRWVEEEHKIVLCAGLDGDTHKRKFGHLLDLIPYANRVTKRSARCEECLEEARQAGVPFEGWGMEASFTASKVPLAEQKVVGGSEIYIPVCRFHHRKYSS